MSEKNSTSIAKACILVLLVLSLFVPACKKASPPKGEASAPQKEEQKAEAPAVQDANKASTTAPELVPIDIKLPKPVFVGTPEPALVKNLEKPLGKPRPAFYAPEGTTNVAFGKPVTGSNTEPIIGQLEMITDGDKEAADGSYVELEPGLQYVAVDLGAEYDIYAILLWHYHKQGLVYFDVVVQVADDADFITNVRTLFNNDDDNSAGLGAGSDKNYTDTYEGKLIDGKGVRARYVRFYSKGNNSNDLNHYTEVEVYGKAAK